MTARESLNEIYGFPISEKDLLRVLVARGLTGDEDLADVVNDCAYRLSYADLLIGISFNPSNTSTTQSMGNFRVTNTSGTWTKDDRNALREEANRIYEECGEPTITTGTEITDGTLYWSESKCGCKWWG